MTGEPYQQVERYQQASPGGQPFLLPCPFGCSDSYLTLCSCYLLLPIHTQLLITTPHRPLLNELKYFQRTTNIYTLQTPFLISKSVSGLCCLWLWKDYRHLAASSGGQPLGKQVASSLFGVYLVLGPRPRCIGTKVLESKNLAYTMSHSGMERGSPKIVEN